jgi:FHS family L-fucose permease-like MFS transporter
MGGISDASNIQFAFIVPLVCYLYVMYFAIAGYKPRTVLTVSDAATAAAEAQ